MRELNSWLERQARRERSVVRLEDALLANRFARYFFYRLRFLFARTAISTVIHAAKIVLILGAFPRSEFLTIVVVQGSAALAGDFWWGALEQMRAEIRLLQRRASRHIIPREIGRWLTLSTRLALVVAFVAVLYGAERLLIGRLNAVDALVVALLIGAALDLVARTYHSGAYALRRVYRPLPSLLALDVVSVGVLVGLWPFIGIWAFPAAELLSVVVVAGISIHYTSRTYQTLALPSLVPLLRLRIPGPHLRALRSAVAPGMSYALVGLEALVVVAGVATTRTAAGADLVVLLAAIAPVSRASFEWARLLYFDLKRLELPLLVDIRRRFDRAVTVVAVLMGGAGAAAAASVAVVLLPDVTIGLVVGLGALFVVRSLLAAFQMQAFTRTAYARLSVAGAVGVALVVITFFVDVPVDLRIAAVAAALAISLVLLVVLPRGAHGGDAIIPGADWLRMLRASRQSVTVTKLSFDERMSARGTTMERRRAEAWRRRSVANRWAAGVARGGGAATWVGQHELWAFQPTRSEAPRVAHPLRVAEPPRVAGPLRVAAGLLDASPVIEEWPDPQIAATTLATQMLGSPADRDAPRVLLNVESLIADFRKRFPAGIAYDTRKPAPTAFTQMPARWRTDVYRAALFFVRGLRRGRGPDGWDVTSVAQDGSLRIIFAVDHRANGAARRAWRHVVREWTLRAAAGVALSSDAPDAQPELPAEVDHSASEAAML
jgi:hypothetical protein